MKLPLKGIIYLHRFIDRLYTLSIQTSSLYAISPESLKQIEGEIWVALTGLNETFFQTVCLRLPSLYMLVE